jgi:hypothetical protein
MIEPLPSPVLMLEDPRESVPHEAEPDGALSLVVALCRALSDAAVPYCHFKSNAFLDRSATGENDLDLLIGAAGAQRFLEVLARLGFREALAPPGRRVPGVTQYYGLDEPTGRLVQVHAHRRLVLGDDTTKNFRLDIEDRYIGASMQGPLFRVPLPEHEFVLFVLRMVAKHCTLDAMMMLQGRLSPSEQAELLWLTERADRGRVDEFVRAELPFVDPHTFDRCLRAIQPGAGARLWFRLRTAGHLHRALATRARRRRVADATFRVSRRVAWGTRKLVRRRARKRLTGGGLFVAVVGGDGAGKSTAVSDLVGWLSCCFATRGLHLGKPPHRAATLALKGPMVLMRRLGFLRSTRVPAYRLQAARASFPGHAWLLWNILTARDRYVAYRRARRFTLSGGVVVSDRMPLPMLQRMDGPRTTWLQGDQGLGRLARALVGLEASYYARIGPPDLLIVLRVDPEIAVQRRATVDEPAFVRDRATEILDVDWTGTPAVVVDAAKAPEEVRSVIRRIVWSRL